MKQVEYRAIAYFKCLSDVKKDLQAEGIDSALLVIAKMKKSFASSSAPTSSQVTIPQHSPAQSTETIALAGGGDGPMKDPS